MNKKVSKTLAVFSPLYGGECVRNEYRRYFRGRQREQ